MIKCCLIFKKLGRYFSYIVGVLKIILKFSDTFYSAVTYTLITFKLINELTEDSMKPPQFAHDAFSIVYFVLNGAMIREPVYSQTRLIHR